MCGVQAVEMSMNRHPGFKGAPDDEKATAEKLKAHKRTLLRSEKQKRTRTDGSPRKRASN
jgi:hypothetical protein